MHRKVVFNKFFKDIFRDFQKFAIFQKIITCRKKNMSIMQYGAKVDILCHQKHIKKNLRVRSFSKMHFNFLKLIKKSGDFFYRVNFFSE